MTFASEKDNTNSNRFMLVKMIVKYNAPSGDITVGGTYDTIAWSGDRPANLQRTNVIPGVSSVVFDIDTEVYSMPTSTDEFYYDEFAGIIYILHQLVVYYEVYIRVPIYLTGETRRYIGSDPTSPDTDVKAWLPYISKYPNKKDTIRNVTNGKITSAISNLNIVNNEFIRAYLTNDYTFRNQDVDAWICIDDVSNIEKSFYGTVDGVKWSADGVSLSLFSGIKEIDTTAFNKFYDNAKTAAIPILFGTRTTSSAVTGYLPYHSAYGFSPSTPPDSGRNRLWGCPQTLIESGSTSMASQSIPSISTSTGKISFPVRESFTLSGPHNLILNETVKFNGAYYGYVSDLAVAAPNFFTMQYFNPDDPTPTSFNAINHPAVVVEKSNEVVVYTPNFILRLNDGTISSVGITPATYTTGHDLAAVIQSQLNAASSNYTATYSTLDNRFTISRSSGTFGITLSNNTFAIHQYIGFPDLTDLTGLTTVSSKVAVAFGDHDFHPIAGVDFTTAQQAGDTVNGLTYYYPKITFANNFEHTRGISLLGASNIVRTGYRPKEQHTHAKALKHILKYVGYTADTTSFSQADSDVDSAVSFSIPDLGGNTWPTYRKPIESILKSTLGYLYQKPDSTIYYGVIKQPSSGTVVDNSNIIKGSFKYRFEYFDLIKDLIIENPYIGIDSNQPVYQNYFWSHEQHFHEMKTTEKTLDHYLLDYTDVVDNFKAFHNNRRLICSFDSNFSFYSNNVGDDLTISGDFTPGGEDINVKITSISKTVTKVSIEAEAFEGFV